MAEIDEDFIVIEKLRQRAVVVSEEIWKSVTELDLYDRKKYGKERAILLGVLLKGLNLGNLLINSIKIKEEKGRLLDLDLHIEDYSKLGDILKTERYQMVEYGREVPFYKTFYDLSKTKLYRWGTFWAVTTRMWGCAREETKNFLVFQHDNNRLLIPLPDPAVTDVQVLPSKRKGVFTLFFIFTEPVSINAMHERLGKRSIFNIFPRELLLDSFYIANRLNARMILMEKDPFNIAFGEQGDFFHANNKKSLCLFSMVSEDDIQDFALGGFLTLMKKPLNKEAKEFLKKHKGKNLIK